MTISAVETQLLHRALALATRAREGGDPPFGSLLADSNGAVLREETNSTLTDGDITAHPELKLARWAASALSHEELEGVTMYTSCEPCSMCGGAIARSGIPRVVFALSSAQLDELKAPSATPTTFEWASDGPHLHPDSTAPVVGYYL
ncbi:nucleoside deaminase [Microbacterium gallinarum]|uniref:Nucleoside deaminase n=1 Tax=Microbacterium gallinarum TaxID=2762209 RepID=A0ABR8WYH2_9MICO|nr:nucleoside deaminase [Microbacterium gallinarum]MBD8022129.1 nucleoside deaminase [Microbacterium gallinarum]